MGINIEQQRTNFEYHQLIVFHQYVTANSPEGARSYCEAVDRSLASEAASDPLLQQKIASLYSFLDLLDTIAKEADERDWKITDVIRELAERSL